MRALRIVALAGLALLAVALAGVGRPEPAASGGQGAGREPAATPAPDVARGQTAVGGAPDVARGQTGVGGAPAVARTIAAGTVAQVSEGQGITVTGSGSVATVPDRASFMFGVETQAATAGQALAANAAAARRLVAALRAAGVAEADLQTQHVSLMPRTSNDGRDVVGYTASNSVTATIRSIARAGAVVDAAVRAGATNVYGPSLTRGDQAGLYRQALRAAVADAREKAETLAAAVGRSLGPVVGVTESGGGGPVPLEARAAVASDTMPVEPGTQSVGASVTVTFALQ